VSGLDRAQRGRIHFDGTDITNFSPDKISQAGLIRTFQTARGFPKLSVYDHLMIYGPRHPGDNLFDALVESGRSLRREQELSERAHSIARRLKLNGVLDSPVTDISGGQRKLLEIGRTLMAEPRLVLLDEPTAGVNPTLTAEIGDHLLSLRESGLTMLLIEHDMGFIARLADHVVVMAEGKRLTEGTYSQVVADEFVQAAYLGRRH
jgi:branched-chain amino acid transport system ATP-binding protein